MILIFTPEDVRKEFKHKPINYIEWVHMTMYSDIVVRQAEFAIFIESKDNWKIFKHRYPIDDERTKTNLNILDINV